MNSKGILILIFFCCLISQPVHAVKVYYGNEESPESEVEGGVRRLISAGPPLKWEFVDCDGAVLYDIFFVGELLENNLAKPVNGDCSRAYICGKEVILIKPVFSDGFLNTKNYGKILVFFRLVYFLQHVTYTLQMTNYLNSG